MRTSIKKSVAILLSVLIATLSPLTVFAEQNDNVSTNEIESEQIVTGLNGDGLEVLTGIEALKEKYHVDFEVTSAMIKEKDELYSVLDSMEEAVPEEAYFENQVVVQTDTEEEAKSIAEGYRGKVVAYQDDIATIELSDLSTVSALGLAADKRMNLPAVYPNLIYSVDDLGSISNQEENEISEEEQKEILDDLQKSLPEKKLLSVEQSKSIKSEQKEVDSVEEAVGTGVSGVNDPQVSKQWFHQNIDTFNAWKVTKGAGVKVAVIDSGINSSHQEFSGRLTCINKVTWQATTYEDAVGHGTHVAGIIGAAANNSYGGVGVAPEVSILAIKALGDTGSGSSADIMAGVRYAIDQKVNVINMSLGGNYPIRDLLYESVIKEAADAGIAVVVAAGNDTLDISKVSNRVYPACIDGTIVVSSLTKENELSWFSNYGRINVSAPGGELAGVDENEIYSTSLATKGGFQYMQGTSMASPVVAGVAALVVASDSTLTKDRAGANAIKNKLQSTAKSLGNKSKFGAGIVNAAAAVGAISIYTKDNNYGVVAKKTLPLQIKKANSSQKITWSLKSGDDAFASINAKNGTIKAKNVTQKTNITVSASTGSFTDSVIVTIYPIKGSITTTFGKNKTMKYSDPKEYFPIKCDTPVIYKSSNNKVVNIDSNGLMKPIANGTATITATAVGGTKVSCKIKVTDTPFYITGVVPVKASDLKGRDMLGDVLGLNAIPMSAGKSLKFKVTSEFPYNTSSDKSVTWEQVSQYRNTNNTTYEKASVDKNGVFKIPKNIDYRVISKVRASNKYSYADIYVHTSKAMKSFAVASKEITSARNTKASMNQQLNAGDSCTAYYASIVSLADVYSSALTSVPYIESSNNSIATVQYITSNGKFTDELSITAKKKGKCKIILTSIDGAYKKAVINVTVK